MLFQTTRNNKEYTRQSKLLVGNEFGFISKIKKRGVGSSRMMIHRTSPNLDESTLEFSEINYGNIELRPKGIIIHYTKKIERYSWIIPYYKMHVYRSEFFSIHADGHFIQFTKNKNYTENKKFIDKMVQEKIDTLGLDYFDY